MIIHNVVVASHQSARSRIDRYIIKSLHIRWLVRFTAAQNNHGTRMIQTAHNEEQSNAKSCSHRLFEYCQHLSS